MITLEIDGTQYSGFTYGSVRRSIEEASGTFAFEITSSVVSNFPIKRRAECRVLIDDVPVLTGFVDIINVSYDKLSHSLMVQGRDKTGILVDSSVQSRTFNKTIGLKKLTEQVISDLGVTIQVINNVDGLANFTKQINAEIGESAYSFIERYCKKAQVLFTTNGYGDVVFTRASTDRIDTLLLSVKNGEQNNILSAMVNYNDARRYREYKVLGQQYQDSGISNLNTTNTSSPAEIDTEALEGKKLII